MYKRQIICNGEMLEDKTLKKLGLENLPDNLILQNGKIIARGIDVYKRQVQIIANRTF